MEIWKKIHGYPPEYEVSSYGRVRFLEREYTSSIRGTPVTRILPEKTCSLRKLSQKGYQRVKICGKVSFVHRLVLSAFVENPENKPQCNHKNGIKTDNRVENLEWVTNQENRDHAVKYGLHATGSRPHTWKYDYGDELEMQNMKRVGLSIRQIALTYGTSHSTITKILSRKH